MNFEVWREGLRGVQRHVQVGRLDYRFCLRFVREKILELAEAEDEKIFVQAMRTFVAGRSEPSQIAVALFTRQCSASNVNTFALQTAVLVGRALVPVLAPRSVIVFITFAFCGEIFSMARARLSVLLSWLDVDVGTGPEAIRVRPLIGLTEQSHCAVVACEVLRQTDLVRLSSAKKGKKLSVRRPIIEENELTWHHF